MERGSSSLPDEGYAADPAPASDPQRQMRIRAAWIYFIEGRTQNEVAEALGLSRISVTRLLADARRRGEVNIQINSPLAEMVQMERALEAKFLVDQAIVAPIAPDGGDPSRVIAAAAGAFISDLMQPNMTVGVGWGRTLYSALPHIKGRPLENVRVISLLGGIAQARRFNPAEFAWQFAELFDGEGYLVPAPALVDSAETKHALLEYCGIDQIFQLAEAMDVALLSVGGISTLTTSYRVGHVSEAERLALKAAGAVGDILYNFIDEAGNLVDHDANSRAVSVGIERLKKVPKKVLMSGGAEKIAALRGALRLLQPTTFITDAASARALLED